MELTGCECSRLADLAVVPIGRHEDIFRTLQFDRKRGLPQWWLGSFSCSVCKQMWLVANEERHNDLLILRRLDPTATGRLIGEDIWPPDFDRFERLLEIGREAGHAVKFPDVTDSTLMHTVADLARERPGIRVSELAALLNLEPTVASEIARLVVSGQPCVCFVCRPGRVVAEPGSVGVMFDVG